LTPSRRDQGDQRRQVRLRLLVPVPLSLAEHETENVDEQAGESLEQPLRLLLAEDNLASRT
jgi:hypothetical protein